MEIKFEDYNIYIKSGETELRKKSIFLFCSKSRKKVFALLWDGNRYLEISRKSVCYGRFKWPRTKEVSTKASADDVRNMAKGQNL